MVLYAMGSDRRRLVGEWARALGFQPGGPEFDPPGKSVSFSLRLDTTLTHFALFKKNILFAQMTLICLINT